MHRSPQFKMARWEITVKVFARGAIDNTRLRYNRSIINFPDVNEALAKALQG